MVDDSQIPWCDAIRQDQTLSATAKEKLKNGSIDPDEIRKAIDYAAAHSRHLWYVYLFVGTYLVVTVGSVTHLDLFLKNPIELPFVQIELPIERFFWISPIIFMVLHAYTLLNFRLLSIQIREYERLMSEAGLDKITEVRLRLQLPNFFIVKAISLHTESSRNIADHLLVFIAWMTLVYLPLILLLFVQIQFLPYHSSLATWIHRIVVIADLGLIAILWPQVINLKETLWRFALRFSASMVLCIFAIFIVTFPGEYLDRKFYSELPVWASVRPRLGLSRLETINSWSVLPDCIWNEASKCEIVPFTIYDLLFGGQIDRVSRVRKSVFDNTLVLPDFDGVNEEKLREIEAREREGLFPGEGERLSSFRGRDLQGAILIGAQLIRTDFTGADLRNADLSEAKLDQALISCEDIGNSVNRSCANLMRASLNGASLNEASLDGARLDGASLDGAWLDGASLIAASLDGAWLAYASMRGAQLRSAALRGASLDAASLQGASFLEARLQGASFIEASLQGANLGETYLEGAHLWRTSLQGASLNGARLEGALLFEVSLWRTSFDGIKGLNKAYILPTFDRFVWTPRRGRTSGVVFDHWRQNVEEDALRRLPKTARERVKSRLSILDFDSLASEQDYKIRNFWRSASAGGPNYSLFKIILSNELAKIICEGSSHIARGLFRHPPGFFQSRLSSLGLPALAIIDRMRRPTQGNCPGAKGLDTRDLRMLGFIKREIVREITSQSPSIEWQKFFFD